MHIRYGFHGADLIGPHDHEDHYDTPASAARYAALIKARLQADYPEAEVEVVYDLDAGGVMPYSLQTMVDDNPTHAEVGDIEHLAGLVYQDYGWCVMAEKEFSVTYGSRYFPQHAEVTLNGVLAREALTPALSARAARVACGHRRGVTVWSNDDHGYRLYAKSARRLTD